MKKGYKDNIRKLTLENTDFRRVLYTGESCQLVLMSLDPGEEIGEEAHDEGDQFFGFESGVGKVVINDIQYNVEAGDGAIVPKGAKHNVINISKTETMKLYTLYAPPHHKDGIVRATREEAEADSPEFDGKTSE